MLGLNLILVSKRGPWQISFEAIKTVNALKIPAKNRQLSKVLTTHFLAPWSVFRGMASPRPLVKPSQHAKAPSKRSLRRRTLELPLVTTSRLDGALFIILGRDMYGTRRTSNSVLRLVFYIKFVLAPDATDWGCRCIHFSSFGRNWFGSQGKQVGRKQFCLANARTAYFPQKVIPNGSLWLMDGRGADMTDVDPTNAIVCITRCTCYDANPTSTKKPPGFPTFLSLVAMVCSMAATHGIRGMGCDALFLVEPALWSRMTLWLFSAISICNHHADQQKSASWLGISLCLDRRNVMWPPHDSDIPMT